MIYRFDVDLKYGPDHRDLVTREDWQRTIEALDRLMDGKPRASDDTALTDLRSILVTMGEQLPSRSPAGRNAGLRVEAKRMP